MFRDKLISAHHQREEETHRQDAEVTAKAEKEVRLYISHVFGAEYAAQAEVKGRKVKIEDIELFVGYNSRLFGDFFLLCGQCPHCGGKCWSEECYSAADVGEQLVDFQVSWTRHKCTGCETLLHRLERHVGIKRDK